MKKIPNNILNLNKNANSFSKKETSINFQNPNHEFSKFSKIIGNSGWYNFKATKPFQVQPSVDGTLNNVLIAPYYFVFELDIDEEQIKNINFLIETKNNAYLTNVGIKQWMSTGYEYNSSGYKISTPTNVWQGVSPRVGTLEQLTSYNALYMKQVWRCSYVYQGSSRSGNLRSICGSYVYATNPGQPDNEVHTVTFFMHNFTNITSSQATGRAYVVDYNNTLSDYESHAFDNDFSVVFADTDYCYGAIGSFSDHTANVFRLDRLDRIDSGLSFTPSEYTGIYQAYYDENYFWPIIYDSITDKLIELPNIETNIYSNPSYIQYLDYYPDIPSSLSLTINEGISISSSDNVEYSGVTSTGQSFFYVKQPNEKYQIRIVGGIVYESKIAISDDAVISSMRENYTTDGLKWTYDSTENIGSLNIPKYTPVSQDVQIRCLINYNSEPEYKSHYKK